MQCENVVREEDGHWRNVAERGGRGGGSGRGRGGRGAGEGEGRPGGTHLRRLQVLLTRMADGARLGVMGRGETPTKKTSTHPGWGLVGGGA